MRIPQVPSSSGAASTAAQPEFLLEILSMTREYDLRLLGICPPDIASRHDDEAMREIRSAACGGDVLLRIACRLQDGPPSARAEEMPNEYH